MARRRRRGGRGGHTPDDREAALADQHACREQGEGERRHQRAAHAAILWATGVGAASRQGFDGDGPDRLDRCVWGVAGVHGHLRAGTTPDIMGPRT